MKHVGKRGMNETRMQRSTSISQVPVFVHFDKRAHDLAGTESL